MNFEQRLSIILENIDQRHINITYQIYNADSDNEQWFDDYSTVITFLSRLDSEIDGGSYGSVTPYYVDKSAEFGGGDRWQKTDPKANYRWATEGEPLASLLWSVDPENLVVEIWVEEDYSISGI